MLAGPADRDPTSSRTSTSRTVVAYQLENPIEVVLPQPVDDEAIRREQAQQAVVIDRLQGADPGIELLLGQLYLQDAEALIPERRFGRQEHSPGGQEWP